MLRRQRTYTTVTDAAILQDWMDEIVEQGYCAFDTETTGLDSQQVDIVGLVFATTPHNACYIPLTHFGDDQQIPIVQAMEICKPVLENAFVIKVMQNAKYDMNVMARYGVVLNGVEDTMLMSLALHSGIHRHNMDEMALKHLGHRTISFSEVAGKGANKVTFDYVPIPNATTYAAEDGAITLELGEAFQKKLAADPAASRVYNDIELPLVPILAKMEQTGVLVDTSYLYELGNRFEEQARKHLADCIEAAGESFNPGSPAQLGHIIHEKFGVPIKERTTSGAPATGVKILESLEQTLSDSSPVRQIVKSVLDYRAVRKLASTYCAGLTNAINPNTGRVHPSFLQHGTQTGRLSCSDPNLQNIPIRTDAGKLIRKAFVTEPGWKIIAADYSQIELRIAAHVADEQKMKAAFFEGHDIHAAMGAQIQGVPIEDVTSDARRDAKRASFGILYGSTAMGLAYTHGISIDQAEELIARYFATFPGIQKYMRGVKEFARTHGFVESHYGRKLWLPEINSNRGSNRRHAERQAINGPIQGTAADIMKFAMPDVAAMLHEEGARTRMLLTVHDELVFEAPEDEVEDIKPKIKHAMENAYELSVPLLVEVESGDNWLEAH